MAVSKSHVIKYLGERGHFALVPNEICLAKISIHARLVWIYLSSQGPSWDSSIANVARNIGIHRNTVQKAVNELRDCNMVSTVQTKRGTDFHIHSPDIWIVEWISRVETAEPTTSATVAQDKCTPQLSPCASAAHPISGIQEANTTNTINTVGRKRPRCSDEGEKNFQEASECKPQGFQLSPVKKDDWHLHFLKSSVIENYFLKLPSNEQETLRSKFNHPEQKDDFVIEMNSRLFSKTSMVDLEDISNYF